MSFAANNFGSEYVNSIKPHPWLNLTTYLTLETNEVKQRVLQCTFMARAIKDSQMCRYTFVVP